MHCSRRARLLELAGEQLAHRRARVLPRDTAWAMSQENVEIVRRAYELVNDGLKILPRGLFDPEYEFDAREVMAVSAGGLVSSVLKPGAASPSPVVWLTLPQRLRCRGTSPCGGNHGRAPGNC